MYSEKNILIVDDFPPMRRIVKTILKKLGLENVEEANDGREALIMLKEGQYDLILSDCNMPNMCGLELLKCLKENEELKNIPFVVMTAKEQEENMVEMAMAGMSDYIVKPFSPEALREKLEKLL
nr:chemotaxis protein CheD [uncultured bacterium]